MRLILNKLYLISGYLAALFILAICTIVMAQVGLNIIDRLGKLFFGMTTGLSIPSYSDFTGFFLAASSFFALAYTLRQGGHIRVTLFISRFSGEFRRWVEIAVVLVAGAITLFITTFMLLLTHESWSFGDLSTGIVPVPIWIPQSAVSSGLIVLSIAFIDEFFCLIKGHEASYEGKGENLLTDKDEETNQVPKEPALSGGE